MVENSLGRLWVEGHPNDDLKANWKYYLEEAKQEPDVQKQLDEIKKEYAALTPDQIRAVDPCMGSGHIICYMFDVLMQIYEAYGYTTRDAVSSIVQNNLYGLDIDERAAQLAYFSVMMTARKYDRRFFRRSIQPHVYAIQESNELNPDALAYFINGNPKLQEAMDTLISDLHDAKEYGSILNVSMVDFPALYARFDEIKDNVNLWRDAALNQLLPFVQCAQTLAQKYHVVVTNPPYMGSSGMSGKLSEFIKKNYPDSKSDLFAVFMECWNRHIVPTGFNCMVTMQSWMFLSSFEKMRENILENYTINNLMHMENMVLGIAFGTAVTNIRNRRLENYRGTYHQIKLEDIVDGIPTEFPAMKNRFAQTSQSNFSKIPGSPVAYWASSSLLMDFEKGYPTEKLVNVKQGLATGDNNRFLRLWYEVDPSNCKFDSVNAEELLESGKKWVPYNKGGERRNWYGNYDYLVNWENDGFEIKHFVDSNGKLRSRPQNTDSYFKDAITWGLITSGGFSIRYRTGGGIHDVSGMSAFYTGKCNLMYLLAILSTPVANYVFKMLNPTINLQVGDFKNFPVLMVQDNQQNSIVSQAQECVLLSKNDWDSFETSWDFQRHPLIRKTATIKEAFSQWQQECDERFNQLKSNEEELNRIFIDIYGLQDELTPEEDEKDVTVRKADLERDIRSFVSYAVGCMFGRYSLDEEGLAYAGGDWDSSKYKTFIPDKDAIIPITDDEYFTDDIVGRFVEFVKDVYGADTLEENLKFIADALGEKGATSREVIRNYFIKDFYKDHCKTYRKRPIYWLFDSGKKNGFKCLIYMHRYQPDTIARIRTDYVHEQQARYRTAISGLERQINGAPTYERVRLNKLMTKLKDQAEETRLYEEKIHHLADQMIEIDLDDGVKHNYAIFQDVLAKIK